MPTRQFSTLQKLRDSLRQMTCDTDSPTYDKVVTELTSMANEAKMELNDLLGLSSSSTSASSAPSAATTTASRAASTASTTPDDLTDVRTPFINRSLEPRTVTTPPPQIVPFRSPPHLALVDAPRVRPLTPPRADKATSLDHAISQAAGAHLSAEEQAKLIDFLKNEGLVSWTLI
jgi:hypothetical protein